MHEMERRFCQRDADFKDLQRQVQNIGAQLHEVESASRAHHQRLQVNATEHRDRVHEVYERAVIHWRDQVVDFAVTGIDHLFQDSCKRNKTDDGAGSSSGVNAV